LSDNNLWGAYFGCEKGIEVVDLVFENLLLLLVLGVEDSNLALAEALFLLDLSLSCEVNLDCLLSPFLCLCFELAE
jgi:hypothetical protein